MEEREVEEMVQKANPTENRLSPGLIDACIVLTQYYQFPNTSHTVCCLTLKNGFTVLGESSSVDPINFNVEIGRKIACEDARKKVWPLEGYLLKESMHRAPRGEPNVSRVYGGNRTLDSAYKPPLGDPDWD